MLTTAPAASPDVAGNMAAKVGFDTPAAWPVGVSLLAQAVDACQRCDAADPSGGQFVRASKAIRVSPDVRPG